MHELIDHPFEYKYGEEAILRVKACNEAGCGDWSDAHSEHHRVTRVPDQIDDIHFEVSNDRQKIDFKW